MFYRRKSINCVDILFIQIKQRKEYPIMIFKNGDPSGLEDPIVFPRTIIVDYDPESNINMTSKNDIYRLCKTIDILKEQDIVVNLLLMLPPNSQHPGMLKIRVGVCTAFRHSSCVNITDYSPDGDYFPLICIGIGDYEMADRELRYDLIAYFLMHEFGHIVAHFAYHDTIYSDEDKILEFSKVWTRKSERIADRVALEFFDNLDTYKKLVLAFAKERFKSEEVDRSEEFRARSSQFDDSWRPRMERLWLKYA